MRVKISESFPGEFDGLSKARLRARANIALDAVTGEQSPKVAYGEMRGLNELVELMGQRFDARAKRIAEDIGAEARRRSSA